MLSPSNSNVCRVRNFRMAFPHLSLWTAEIDIMSYVNIYAIWSTWTTQRTTFGWNVFKGWSLIWTICLHLQILFGLMGPRIGIRWKVEYIRTYCYCPPTVCPPTDKTHDIECRRDPAILDTEYCTRSTGTTGSNLQTCETLQRCDTHADRCKKWYLLSHFEKQQELREIKQQ